MKKLILTLISTCISMALFAQTNASYPTASAGNGDSGMQNTSVGIAAGNSLSIVSTNNTLIGFNAGFNTFGSSNTFVGSFSGQSNTTGAGNAFFGISSGRYHTTGKWNTFIGNGAGQFSTSGTHNTFLGTGTGANNGTGGGNTYTGAYAGYQATGSYNTFFGGYAGENNSADANTFIGHTAGRNNTAGANNVFVGQSTGINNTFGSSNTFIGKESGYKNREGENNTFVGYHAGYNNETGANTYIGYASGEANASGNANTFVGFKTGNLTTADGNTFVGHQAGHKTTVGSQNTFIGHLAGNLNETGVDNVFIGTWAGNSNKTAHDNTFVGGLSGTFNERGEQNTFLGKYSGNKNLDGSRNTYLGVYSGYHNVVGEDNVYVGYNAGNKGQRAFRNVFLGYEAGYFEEESNKLHIANDRFSNLIYGDFSKNHVAIGTIPPTAYQDKYTLYVDGDAYATGFWQSSDARLKKNRQVITGALDKVRKIKGVTYTYKSDQKINLPKGKQVGFMAQELKEVLPEAVAELKDGSLAVDYSKVVPLLVEAIKELSGEIENMKSAAHSNSEEIESINNNGVLNDLRGFGIEQNYPNPADGQTTIVYQIPSEFIGKARLVVFDLQGKKVTEIEGLLPGRNELNLSKSEIGTGLFHYSLVVDNQIVETKKMLLE
ncbi:tail fiber domain-containing protein [Ekhidna sp.]|uniref:tail fiber domain-containing protein n=1 Tax=Ekhidna sp. TaxID=2608089 RepID=UPI003298A49D